MLSCCFCTISFVMTDLQIVVTQTTNVPEIKMWIENTFDNPPSAALPPVRVCVCVRVP